MFNLVWNNISRRRSQSALTVAITMVTVMVFVMVLGIMQVMDQGLELSRQRLGADAVLIPKYAPTQSEELLFTAVPENVYMKKEVYEQAKQLEGIAQMTPQFYAQTLELGCCEPGEEARIIGFDYESDFILTPFLMGKGIESLGEKDLIIGANMDSDILGTEYMILATDLFAREQLEVTGTGLDSTLFMDIDTCRQLCLDNEVISQSWQKRNPYDYISVIMVRFEEGVDPEAFVKQVEDSGIEIRCVLTSETISSLQSQMKVTMNVMLALWAACMLVAVMALFGRFSALARERKKEIGLLRAMGVKKHQIFALVSGECSMLAAIGGVLGAAAALLLMPNAIALLEDAFMLSSSVWDSNLAIICCVSGVLLAVLLGFGSALVPAVKSAALDPQVAITQGEV
ncbi:MAG: ABC transporter permease [Oscillospiraceae bacterium]|nr:ABC transporter permease [Oscillospiraceae bacterium]